MKRCPVCEGVAILPGRRKNIEEFFKKTMSGDPVERVKRALNAGMKAFKEDLAK